MTSDRDLPELPDDPELERATRDLLRNDPLELDVDRRERAISAALAAADELPELAVPTAPLVRDLRSRRAARGDALRPVLVAAAAVVVVATGVFAVSELGGSGSGNDDMAAQGAAVDERSTSADADGPGEQESAPDAEPGPAPSTGGTNQGADAPTTTAPSGPVSLGEHPDVTSLLDAAQRTVGFDATRTADAATAESLPAAQSLAAGCASELADRDGVPIAVATVAATPVVIAVLADGTTVVLRVEDCVELGRR